jgi:hypothetical protein
MFGMMANATALKNAQKVANAIVMMRAADLAEQKKAAGAMISTIKIEMSDSNG